ncbi:17162_t:CDS:2 [Funneliformis geosporum]|uniref:15250_t:CDS:1 n=1 Tax=Funneliformis geosporum TaxID=1117311 RepID=A0A9W4SAQ9_9GLOM|nr:15250_t:CDS:2 [Funneliformis geosporum]CAI2162242.1 17162_t:CDS:2 [Funneliformis geosporum]
MRHAGKEPVILPYEKVFPEKATTIPEYLQKELDNIDQTWENKYDLSNLDYSNFMLQNNSENNSSTPPQLPLRLYNLKTEEVEETKEDEKERTVTKKDGKTYEVKLTKLGRKALNKSDPIEKGQEVANQKQYYSNATATLIAVDAEIGEEVNRENKLELAKHITKKIVTSPWFTRAWTFQEGLLSKQTIFMFDDYLVDGKILALVWSSFQHDYLEPRLRNLNTKPEIFITPFAVKHRKQTVALDGIYSILGLLPYGNKVEPNYQPRFCSQCPNQKETKDCSHEEENKK